MNEHYESIKNRTTCSECNGKQMKIFYLYEPHGIVKTSSPMSGNAIGSGNMLLIACTGCGHLEKTFLIGK